ncbi:hypothetical protein [Bergeriella denitrificans]|uniref:Uncharacterized protein n=1 Tax=Bergeriella denitrificans TaxID=494 RepID=A0A378ULJ8_BERDE|nr:hypothetical protein [Bergeriella denitrificans]STZ77361.1 Uncharacterised protein [Bergeriella denitrificans]
MKVKLHFLPSANHPAVALLQNTSIEIPEFAIPQRGDILNIEGIYGLPGKLRVSDRYVHIDALNAFAALELMIELDQS